MPEFLATTWVDIIQKFTSQSQRRSIFPPKFLLFKTQPPSRQLALASLCLNGTDQEPASRRLSRWNLPTEMKPPQCTPRQCLLSCKGPLGSRENQSFPLPLSWISYICGHFHPSVFPRAASLAIHTP